MNPDILCNALIAVIFFSIIRKAISSTVPVARAISVRAVKTPHKIHNESGIVLITVIIMVLVLTVVTLSIVGTNMSQMKSSSLITENLQAAELAKGHMVRLHQLQIDGCPAAAGCTTPGDCSTCPLMDELNIYVTNLDGRDFSVSYIDDADDEAYNETDQYSVFVGY